MEMEALLQKNTYMFARFKHFQPLQGVGEIRSILRRPGRKESFIALFSQRLEQEEAAANRINIWTE